MANMSREEINSRVEQLKIMDRILREIDEKKIMDRILAEKDAKPVSERISEEQIRIIRKILRIDAASSQKDDFIRKYEDVFHEVRGRDKNGMGIFERMEEKDKERQEEVRKITEDRDKALEEIKEINHRIEKYGNEESDSERLEKLEKDVESFNSQLRKLGVYSTKRLNGEYVTPEDVSRAEVRENIKNNFIDGENAKKKTFETRLGYAQSIYKMIEESDKQAEVEKKKLLERKSVIDILKTCENMTALTADVSFEYKLEQLARIKESIKEPKKVKKGKDASEKEKYDETKKAYDDIIKNLETIQDDIKLLMPEKGEVTEEEKKLIAQAKDRLTGFQVAVQRYLIEGIKKSKNFDKITEDQIYAATKNLERGEVLTSRFFEDWRTSLGIENGAESEILESLESLKRENRIKNLTVSMRKELEEAYSDSSKGRLERYEKVRSEEDFAFKVVTLRKFIEEYLAETVEISEFEGDKAEKVELEVKHSLRSQVIKGLMQDINATYPGIIDEREGLKVTTKLNGQLGKIIEEQNLDKVVSTLSDVSKKRVQKNMTQMIKDISSKSKEEKIKEADEVKEEKLGKVEKYVISKIQTAYEEHRINQCEKLGIDVSELKTKQFVVCFGDEIEDDRHKASVRTLKEVIKKEAIMEKGKYFGTLDNAIEYLQEKRNRGENVSIEFNGNILYSMDFTIDSVYLQVCGLTKAEHEEIGKKYREAKTQEEKDAITQEYEKLIEAHKNETKKEEKATMTLEERIEQKYLEVQKVISTYYEETTIGGEKALIKTKALEDIEKRDRKIERFNGLIAQQDALSVVSFRKRAKLQREMRSIIRREINLDNPSLPREKGESMKEYELRLYAFAMKEHEDTKELLQTSLEVRDGIKKFRESDEKTKALISSIATLDDLEERRDELQSLNLSNRALVSGNEIRRQCEKEYLSEIGKETISELSDEERLAMAYKKKSRVEAMERVKPVTILSPRGTSAASEPISESTLGILAGNNGFKFEHGEVKDKEGGSVIVEELLFTSGLDHIIRYSDEMQTKVEFERARRESNISLIDDAQTEIINDVEVMLNPNLDFEADAGAEADACVEESTVLE